MLEFLIENDGDNFLQKILLNPEVEPVVASRMLKEKFEDIVNGMSSMINVRNC